MRLILAIVVVAVLPSIGTAQFIDEASSDDSAQLGQQQTVRLQIGLVIRARDRALQDVTGYTPVPIEWPEQQVQLIAEKTSPHVASVEYESVGGTMKRMVVKIPRMQAGESANALVTFDVTRHEILAPKATSQFSIPKKTDRQLRHFLAPSPYIETKNSRIRKLAREVPQAAEGDWKKVETIYDWVRENVRYQRGPIKGAFAALKDGTGDCEELSSLFIAMCRVNRIPARIVWVPGHCYPEFYLVDAKGHGHWFPCQAAGDRAFGSMPEYRPILQKGDNFRVPGHKERQHYVAEHLKVSHVPRGHEPEVEFVRKVLKD